MITADKLRELLDYDPDTGLFTWKVRKADHVHVGDVAGCFDRYIRIKIDGRIYGAHRLAWLYMYGTWPDGQLDHENEIKTDNRISNLREATNAQNQHNMSKPNRNGTTGVLGVTYDKSRGSFRAHIEADGKSRTIGRFDTLEQARAARIAAKKVLHPFWTPTET